MINWLLVITLLVLCYGVYVICKHCFIAPCVVVSGVMLLSSIIVAINTSYWGYVISLKTYFIITLSVAFFIGGYMLGERVKVAPRISNLSYCESYDLITPHRLFYYFAVVYAALVVVLYFRQQYSIAQQAGLTGSFSEIIQANRFYDESAERSSLIRFLFVVLKVVSYFLVLVYVKSKNRGEQTHLIKTLIVVVLYAFCCVLTTNRGDLIAMSSTFIFLVAYFSFQKNGWRKKKGKFKNVVLLLAVFATVLIVFRLLGYLTGKSETYSFYDNVCIYIGSPIICLDKVIVGTSNLPKDYHASLFSALKRTLNSLGFIFPVSASATPHQYWTSENGRWGSNVYTSLFPFFVNYGGAVLLALETFFGFIYGAMWKFLKSKAVTWSAILVYADLFFYYIAMFSIAERILSQLFTITSLVEILFIFLLLRGLTRPKTVE